jgi:3-hydroxyacyl-CoA dehydrogenase
MAPARPGPMPPVQKTFETIAFAKVSTSAHEAIFYGYLKKSDRVVINRDYLLFEAKREALSMAENYSTPRYRDDIFLPGLRGRLAIELAIENYHKAGTISKHDEKIAKKLAYVLTGGERSSPLNPVDEQYILDIEREVFVSLAGEKLTWDRIDYMLKTGKPLRN